jgi:hypothetical protein
MATPDSLDKKAAAEKEARAKESQERLAAAKKRVAKARAVKAKFDVQIGGSPNEPTVIAKVKGSERIAGWMQFEKPDAKGFREISMVNVETPSKRQGIATTLFLEAKKAGLKPVHSPKRTDGGDAFARSVGGRVPDVDWSRPEQARENAMIKNLEKAANKKSGQKKAVQIARDKAFEKLSREREAATQARRNATMIPYRPPTGRLAPPSPPTGRPVVPWSPPTVTGGLLPRGINAANRIAGPLGMVGFMFDAVKQVNNARKPAAMLF